MWIRDVQSRLYCTIMNTNGTGPEDGWCVLQLIAAPDEAMSMLTLGSLPRPLGLDMENHDRRKNSQTGIQR
jgi:hypothetical protein